MAVVFTSFVDVFNDLGIGAALVQKKSQTLTENHFHTAFWTGVGWSLVIFALMVFVITPLASGFYNEPILNKVIPVLSLGILSSPINLVHKAQLMRAMNFKRLAQIDNISNVFSGILALVLAFLGAGVWSLVFNSLATFIIAMPLFFISTKWFPKFIWEKNAFDEIFGFGVYTTGTNLFNNLVNKLDYLLIGKLVSASVLGAYTLAFVLTDTFRSQLMGIMNKVMYPVYGKQQDDKVSMTKYYLNVVKYNSLIIFPIMALFVILAEPGILFFFGEKWVDTIWPLKILSASVIIHMLANSNTVLIRGMGKPQLEMKIQMFKALVVFAPAVYIGVLYFGSIGAAGAVFLNKLISLVIAQVVLKRLLGITYKDLYMAVKYPIQALLASLAVGFISWEYLHFHFLLVAMIMLVTYLALTWISMKDELMLLYKKIRPAKLIIN